MVSYIVHSCVGVMNWRNSDSQEIIGVVLLLKMSNIPTSVRNEAFAFCSKGVAALARYWRIREARIQAKLRTSAAYYRHKTSRSPLL
jgi:hypothetical protein